MDIAHNLVANDTLLPFALDSYIHPLYVNNIFNMYRSVKQKHTQINTAVNEHATRRQHIDCLYEENDRRTENFDHVKSTLK